jgi:hypothetical protein
VADPMIEAGKECPKHIDASPVLSDLLLHTKFTMQPGRFPCSPENCVSRISHFSQTPSVLLHVDTLQTVLIPHGRERRVQKQHAPNGQPRQATLHPWVLPL